MAKKNLKRTTRKKSAWKAFSMYIRVRDAIKTTNTLHSFICISCGNLVPVKNNDAGHFISGRSNSVLYHEEVVHGQCARCNNYGQGEYIKYEKAMREIYGFEKTEELKLLKWQVVKYSVPDFVDIEELYEQKLKDLIEGWEKENKSE